MPEESISIQENQECNENYSNNISSTENKSNSDTLSSSDQRDEIKSNRSLKRKYDSDERTDNLKIVKDCHAEESNDVESSNLANKEVFSTYNIELYKEYVQWDFINNKLYMKVESLLNIVNNEENLQRGKQNARGGKYNVRGGKQNARGGNQNGRGGNPKRELRNTLQRWLIFINEDFNDVPKYEYFSILPDIQLEHHAAQFLRTAIIEKKFATERDADWKVKEILSFISTNHSQVVRHDLTDPLHVELDKAGNIVVVKEFQSEEMSRINLLVTKGGVIATARVLLRYESLGNGSYQWRDPEEVHSEVVPHDLADPLHVEHNETRNIGVVKELQSKEWPRVNLLVTKGGEIATARVLLRYESLGNGSYQWGDPKEVYKVLYEKFDVRYEGFASPVNSGFIEYDETHFCSLFPETDAAFGSIGNFFDVDMEKHSGGWKVNPPFLNDLMKNVAIRIIETLDAGHKCYFFCTFPCWKDDEGWDILNNSRHMLKRFDLPPKHFIVQDAYGNKLEPYMSMNLFVMGKLPPHDNEKARLEELENILIHKNGPR